MGQSVVHSSLGEWKRTSSLLLSTTLERLSTIIADLSNYIFLESVPDMDRSMDVFTQVCPTEESWPHPPLQSMMKTKGNKNIQTNLQ